MQIEFTWVVINNNKNALTGKSHMCANRWIDDSDNQLEPYMWSEIYTFIWDMNGWSTVVNV